MKIYIALLRQYRHSSMTVIVCMAFISLQACDSSSNQAGDHSRSNGQSHPCDTIPKSQFTTLEVDGYTIQWSNAHCDFVEDANLDTFRQHYLDIRPSLIKKLYDRTRTDATIHSFDGVLEIGDLAFMAMARFELIGVFNIQIQIHTIDTLCRYSGELIYALGNHRFNIVEGLLEVPPRLRDDSLWHRNKTNRTRPH